MDQLLPKLKSTSAFREGAPRSVQPEILDGLHENSIEALASRKDLRILNRLLGNQHWFKRVLRNRLKPGDQILEVGAGDGGLNGVMSATGVKFAGLDLGGRPKEWAQEGGWFQTDVFNFPGWNDFPVVIANLFFHHFDDGQLARLGNRFGRTRLIVANEPLRAQRADRLFALVGPLIGAHPVTRYDARVSIAAGFRNDELPRLLGLDPAVWEWRVRETWRGASRLVAEKRS